MMQIKAMNDLDKMILKDPPRDEILKVICDIYSQMSDYDREVIADIAMDVSGKFDKVGPISVLEMVFQTALFVSAKKCGAYKNNVQWKIDKKKSIESYAERKGLWTT